jgi:hypothetical protein
MNTVKEKAIAYAQKAYPEIAAEAETSIDGAIMGASTNGFIAGVEFAQRWISVKEELPPPVSEYIHTSRYVLIRTDIVFIRTATYDHRKHGWVTERGKGLDKDLGKITHWRHIELK